MLKEKGKGVSSALICWAFLLIHKVALCSYAIFQKNVKVHYIYKKGSFSVKLVNQPFTKKGFVSIVVREEQWEVNLAKVEKDFYHPSFDHSEICVIWGG